MSESYMDITFENLETVRVPNEYVFWFEFAHDLDSEGSSQYWLELAPEAGSIVVAEAWGGTTPLRERLRMYKDIVRIETYVNGLRQIDYFVEWTDDSDEMIENNAGFFREDPSGDIHVGAGEYYRRAVE